MKLKMPTCCQKLMKYFGFYYYSAEQQIMKIEFDKDNVKWLVVNHYTKNAFIAKDPEIVKKKFNLKY